MTTLREIIQRAIDPALNLLPDAMDTREAAVLMLTICGQEADFHHRWQVVDRRRPDVRGPAGFMFE